MIPKDGIEQVPSLFDEIVFSDREAAPPEPVDPAIVGRNVVVGVIVLIVLGFILFA